MRKTISNGTLFFVISGLTILSFVSQLVCFGELTETAVANVISLIISAASVRFILQKLKGFKFKLPWLILAVINTVLVCSAAIAVFRMVLYAWRLSGNQ